MATSETPPRAWGRPEQTVMGVGHVGNTPTGVGKTPSARPGGTGAEKHPHGRGEDSSISRGRRRIRETPPRAWGRPPNCNGMRNQRGNTPTGVGKTSSSAGTCCAVRKHPHGRGEDPLGLKPPFDGMETPPRAWGRPAEIVSSMPGRRNTPTGVGKTRPERRRHRSRRKHPHGRGEDAFASATFHLMPETPPRAWGRPDLAKLYVGASRNTPTGVGKTSARHF